MKMTITAEFVNEQTPEEAVASLAKHLMESIVWREDLINHADRLITLPAVRQATIELRALHATIVFGAVRHPHPDPADMLYKGDLFGRDLSAEEYSPR